MVAYSARAASIRRPLIGLIIAALLAMQCLPVFAGGYAITLLGSGYTSSSAQAINGGRIALTLTASNGSTTAAVWTISTSSRNSLSVGAGIGSAEALAIDGNIAAGQVYSTANSFYHAYSWNLSSGTFLDMNPSGFSQSAVYGVSNGAFAGYGTSGGTSVALYWPTTSATPANLNPSVASSSTALAISGSSQVGSATIAANGHSHAAIWHGTAVSYVDLHAVLSPSMSDSIAAAVSGTQIVGTAYDASQAAHAIAWNTAGTQYVDLTPPGFASADGAATNGTQQAGDIVRAGGNAHASTWFGTATSYVDLQTYLPGAYVGSTAYGIDSAGRIVGVAYDVNSVAAAVLWTPVPTNLVWAGGLNGNRWDVTTTKNWLNTAVGNQRDLFFNGDGVTFNDSGSTSGAVTINGVLQPGSITLTTTNAASTFTFTGTDSITGSTSLVLNGVGTLTLSNTNTYAGGTFIEGGKLIVTSPRGIADGTSLYVGTSGSVFAPQAPSLESAAIVTPVPEPATWALLTTGMACLLLRRCRRHLKSSPASQTSSSAARGTRHTIHA
jgi:autotransporter-associated beta strand protein